MYSVFIEETCRYFLLLSKCECGYHSNSSWFGQMCVGEKPPTCHGRIFSSEGYRVHLDSRQACGQLLFLSGTLLITFNVMHDNSMNIQVRCVISLNSLPFMTYSVFIEETCRYFLLLSKCECGYHSNSSWFFCNIAFYFQKQL
jgi:hypothetical protein